MIKQNFNIKKAVYIFACAFLGLLLSFIVHAVVEMAAIDLLTGNFEKYSLGFSWEAWFMIHGVLSVVLAAAGIIFGIWLGFRWYHYVYERGKGGFVKNVLNDHRTLLKS